MTKFRVRDLNDVDDENPLQDHEAVRVPLTMMDGVQKSIAANSPAEAVRLTEDAMRRKLVVDNSYHRPGYRLSTKLLHDAEARDALETVYRDHELDLCSRWKTPAGPITARTADDSVLDESSDEETNYYDAYSAEISQRWRSK